MVLTHANMQLYLLRHAIAEDPRPGISDSDRALTPEGVQKLNEVLKHARIAGLNPSAVLSSPYRRAQETANIAAKALDFKGEVNTTSTLIPESNAEDTWDEIRLYRGEHSLLLVGHEPAMGQLTGFLLNCLHLQVDFKKATIIRIDVPSLGAHPRGVLKWMMAPKLAS